MKREKHTHTVEATNIINKISFSYTSVLIRIMLDVLLWDSMKLFHGCYSIIIESKQAHTLFVIILRIMSLRLFIEVNEWIKKTTTDQPQPSVFVSMKI